MRHLGRLTLLEQCLRVEVKVGAGGVKKACKISDLQPWPGHVCLSAKLCCEELTASRWGLCRKCRFLDDAVGEGGNLEFHTQAEGVLMPCC